MLDHQYYPHLVDAILSYADDDALLAIRGASRSMRDVVDTLLSTHIVLRTVPGRARTLWLGTPSGMRLPSTRECMYAGRYGDDPRSSTTVPAVSKAAHESTLELVRRSPLIDIVGWSRLPRSLQWGVARTAGAAAAAEAAVVAAGNQVEHHHRPAQIVRQYPLPADAVAASTEFAVPMYGDMPARTLVWFVPLDDHDSKGRVKTTGMYGNVPPLTGRLVMNFTFTPSDYLSRHRAAITIRWPNGNLQGRGAAVPPAPGDETETKVGGGPWKREVVFIFTRSSAPAKYGPTGPPLAKLGGLLISLATLDPPFALTLVDLDAVHPAHFGCAEAPVNLDGDDDDDDAAPRQPSPTFEWVRRWLSDCLVRRNGVDGARRRAGRAPWSVRAVSRKEYAREVGEKQFALEAVMG